MSLKDFHHKFVCNFPIYSHDEVEPWCINIVQNVVFLPGYMARHAMSQFIDFT